MTPEDLDSTVRLHAQRLRGGAGVLAVWSALLLAMAGGFELAYLNGLTELDPTVWFRVAAIVSGLVALPMTTAAAMAWALGQGVEEPKPKLITSQPARSVPPVPAEADSVATGPAGDGTTAPAANTTA